MEATIDDRLQQVADRSTLQVTHIGRKSGKAYQVTTWFVVQGDKILLPTSNIDRNWVRNVRKTPHVELSIGADKFSGDAHLLENYADSERVRAKVQRKYWIGGPILTLLELLARFGLGTFQVRRFRSIAVRVNVNRHGCRVMRARLTRIIQINPAKRKPPTNSK